MYTQPTSDEYGGAWLEAERRLAIHSFQVLVCWVETQTEINPPEEIPNHLISEPESKDGIDRTHQSIRTT